MRAIDRLLQFLSYKKITAYSFERNCQVANGYLKKQNKGRGTIGSDIMLRIHRNYSDLSLTWLISGEGEMLVSDKRESDGKNLAQEGKEHYTKVEKMQFLSERIALLESSLADKKMIIELLEKKKKKS